MNTLREQFLKFRGNDGKVVNKDALDKFIDEAEDFSNESNRDEWDELVVEIIDTVRDKGGISYLQFCIISQYVTSERAKRNISIDDDFIIIEYDE